MVDYSKKATSILNRLNNDFHKDIFKASIELLETPIKTKFSNFATNIRELTREVFSSLAPDNEVRKCEWYREENTVGNFDITRMQRMVYAIKGGLSDNFIKEELNIDIDDVTSRFNKVIRNLNKYTHINEKVYYQDATKGYEMVAKTLSILDDFLGTIEETRLTFVSALEKRLYDQISDTFTSDIIQTIDILSTHYLVQEETIDEVEVLTITSTELILNVHGSIGIEHQYGSNGDFKRGDGIRVESYYPFKIQIILQTQNPLTFSISHSDILIDDSSFFE